jgi:hypothetical protein
MSNKIYNYNVHFTIEQRLNFDAANNVFTKYSELTFDFYKKPSIATVELIDFLYTTKIDLVVLKNVEHLRNRHISRLIWAINHGSKVLHIIGFHASVKRSKEFFNQLDVDNLILERVTLKTCHFFWNGSNGDIWLPQRTNIYFNVNRIQLVNCSALLIKELLDSNVNSKMISEITILNQTVTQDIDYYHKLRELNTSISNKCHLTIKDDCENDFVHMINYEKIQTLMDYFLLN